MSNLEIYFRQIVICYNNYDDVTHSGIFCIILKIINNLLMWFFNKIYVCFNSFKFSLFRIGKCKNTIKPFYIVINEDMLIYLGRHSNIFWSLEILKSGTLKNLIIIKLEIF